MGKYCIAHGKYTREKKFSKVQGLDPEVQERVRILAKWLAQESNTNLTNTEINTSYICYSCYKHIHELIELGNDYTRIQSQYGNGLRALKAFESGEVVAVYGGELIADLKVSELVGVIPTSHFMSIDHRFLLNGAQGFKSTDPGRTIKGVAQFINVGAKPNIKWDKSNKLLMGVLAIATRRIEPGEELFANYKIYYEDLNPKKRKLPQNLSREYRDARIAKKKRQKLEQ
jgi:SET domain